MILTVSLNPAIDRTCELDKLLIGKVNRVQKSTVVAGGKGINVTKVLCKFDMPVIAMGFLGGEGGNLIENVVNEMGADCTFTRTFSDTRISTNVISADGKVTEILEPGAGITQDEVNTFLEQYKAMLGEADVVVLSGSLPVGVENDFYAKLIELAHEEKSIVIVDSSKEALSEAVKAKPDCIKPNLHELEMLMERPLKNDEEIKKAAEELLERGVGCVAVSMGAKGLWVFEKSHTYRSVPPKIEAVNTVGCGDCVVAALAMGYFEKKDFEEAVRQAVCVSAANALTLENGDIPMRKLRGLYEKIKVEIKNR
ncbi:MAG: 1-phosphofructokinase [Lachnospiraceae bacterium]|jgi:tagatose 6-phosphate kinase|nr:1-phosphofructokinase [Lachnospiraceae bacterium]